MPVAILALDHVREFLTQREIEFMQVLNVQPNVDE